MAMQSQPTQGSAAGTPPPPCGPAPVLGAPAQGPPPTHTPGQLQRQQQAQAVATITGINPNRSG
eukprot:6920083-Alexandrium_andersonii.AAC.1